MDVFYPPLPAAGPQSKVVIGIDLGTTYSVIAHVDESGQPMTLLNDAGDLLTPSVVLFEEGEVIVGREALKASVMEPDAFAECFKRDIGGISYRRRVKGIEIPPEVLSAFVLNLLKQEAVRQLGPVSQAVITVPAFFDETRRKATQDAGRLAGWDVLDIINEPTAAALAYGYRQGLTNRSADSPATETVLIYDLGGGTFDVTILEISGSQFRAIATDGDMQLGGKDFDERIVNHVAQRFEAEHGVDPRSDPADATQLWLHAEEAKHALSKRQKTTVVCFHDGKRTRVDITRPEFEDLTRDLIERTETTTSLLVEDAGLDWGKIDRIIAVGGSTRIPMVTAMLLRLSGVAPDCSQSADEAVAHGAALYARMLTKDSGPRKTVHDFKLINVNSHSLGVVGVNQTTKRRVNSIVIPRNTPLPCRIVKSFVTAKDDQQSVIVPVVEGESSHPDNCISLGQCIVRDLPPGLPAGTEVQVEYSYAANGRIAVSARVPSTRQSAHVEFQREARNLEDLETWRRRLQGSETTPTETVAAPVPGESNDQVDAEQRFDDLVLSLGQKALSVELPSQLASLQDSTRRTVNESTEASTVLQNAEIGYQNATGRSERVRLSSELAQAKSIAARAFQHAESSLRELGRAVVASRRTITGLEQELDAIARLR